MGNCHRVGVEKSAFGRNREKESLVDQFRWEVGKYQQHAVIASLYYRRSNPLDSENYSFQGDCFTSFAMTGCFIP